MTQITHGGMVGGLNDLQFDRRAFALIRVICVICGKMLYRHR